MSEQRQSTNLVLAGAITLVCSASALAWRASRD
jgi:hypothetical protein